MMLVDADRRAGIEVERIFDASHQHDEVLRVAGAAGAPDKPDDFDAISEKVTAPVIPARFWPEAHLRGFHGEFTRGRTQ